MNDESLAQQVYQTIMQKLFDHELVGGQMITRRGMAKLLGVSIAPVSEAFAALERDGLLITLPRKGTQIRSFAVADLQEQSVVRLALESQVARIICGPTVQAHRDELEPLALQLDQSQLKGAALRKADIAFHRRLAELTEQSLLINMLSQVLLLRYFCALQEIVAAEPVVTERTSHGRLLKQLLIRDPDAAAHAMREHLLSGQMGQLLDKQLV